MPDCLVAFGSNIGDGATVFAKTRQQLESHQEMQDVVASPLVRTRPVGGSGQRPSFLNACLRLKTALPLPTIFQMLLELEQQFGRRRVEHWGDRVIDLDLLLYDDHQCHRQELVVPHPRMSFRRFVLHPAAARLPGI